jgi:glycine/D-amino acid oxidase-like deaminating enzyme
MAGMRAGIVVIGGNIMGAMAANELARRADPLRDPVVLLEAGALEERAPATATIVEGGFDPSDPVRPALIDGARHLLQFEANVGRGIGLGWPGLVELGDAPDPNEETAWQDPKALYQIARELQLDSVERGRWSPKRALFQAERLHAEVLGLGRTRGVVTRPGTTVQAVRLTADGVEIDTLRGDVTYTWHARQVLFTDAAECARFLPALAANLERTTHTEAAFHSPRFATGAVPLGTIQGSVQNLHEIASTATHPDPFHAFFSGDEELEYPHPAIEIEGMRVYPNPIDGEVLASMPHGAPDVDALAQLSPLFRELTPTRTRTLEVVATSDGVPLVGSVPLAHLQASLIDVQVDATDADPAQLDARSANLDARVYVAIGLGYRAAQIAAGLAPGVVNLMHAEAVVAFDVERLAPTRLL